MKTALVIGSVLFALAARGGSGPLSPAAEVERAEHVWMEAMQHRDGAALNRVVAPNFALAGIDDLDRPAVPRSVWIDNTLHHLNVKSFAFRKLTVTVFGDVAVARSTFNWSGAFNGETFNDTTVLVDTWVRQGNAWVVVSRLVGDAPPAAPAKGKR